MKFAPSIVVSAAALALLSACGGGDSATPPDDTQSVAISSSNQSAVARATINAGLSVASTQGSVGVASPTGVLSRAHALDVVVKRALSATTIARKGIAGANAHATAASSQTTACGVSGSFTSTFDDRDGNGMLSSGDVLTATFSQCQETPSLAISSGTVVITLTANPDGMVFDANGTFQDVVVADNGVSSTLSGAAAVQETDGDTLSGVQFTVGTGGLTVVVASTNYNDTIAFDPGMVIETSEVGGNSVVSSTMSGSFTASSIGGRVTIATPVALMQKLSDAYPSSGEVRATGASGSTLLATVLSDTQVQLQLDANGDGTYDSTTTVAWSTLVP
jgi:hypothetical protein